MKEEKIQRECIADISPNDELNIAEKLKEISAKKQEIKRIKKIVMSYKIEKVKKNLSESGKIYTNRKKALDSLKYKYNENINLLNERYVDLCKNLYAQRDNLDKELEYRRVMLTCARGDLSDLRRLPEIKMYENLRTTYRKEIKKLENQLENNNLSSDEKEHIGKNINEKKDELTRNKKLFASTNLGKEYFSRAKRINDAIIEIKQKNEELEYNKGEEQKINDEYNKVFSEYSDEYQQDKLKIKSENKQNIFIKIAGATKANLGIGEYKQDNNLVDIINNIVTKSEKIYNEHIKNHVTTGIKETSNWMKKFTIENLKKHAKFRIDRFYKKNHELTVNVQDNIEAEK